MKVSDSGAYTSKYRTSTRKHTFMCIIGTFDCSTWFSSYLAMEWFSWYLSGRHQRVCIDGHVSSARTHANGVPQGLVLGPVLFSLYTYPLQRIIQNTALSAYHKYADDLQLYIPFDPKDTPSSSEAWITMTTDIHEKKRLIWCLIILSSSRTKLKYLLYSRHIIRDWEIVYY